MDEASRAIEPSENQQPVTSTETVDDTGDNVAETEPGEEAEVGEHKEVAKLDGVLGGIAAKAVPPEDKKEVESEQTVDHDSNIEDKPPDSTEGDATLPHENVQDQALQPEPTKLGDVVGEVAEVISQEDCEGGPPNDQDRDPKDEISHIEEFHEELPPKEM